MANQKAGSLIIPIFLVFATIATAVGGALLLFAGIAFANLTRGGLSLSDDWPLLVILVLSATACIASWVMYNANKDSQVAVFVAVLGALVLPLVLLTG